MGIVKIVSEREGEWIDQLHFTWDKKQYSSLLNDIYLKYFKYVTKLHVQWQKQITWMPLLDLHVEHRELFAYILLAGTR